MTQPKADEDLLSRYLAVCNQALEENKDRFPFKQVLGAARDKTLDPVQVSIIDDMPQSGFSIQLQNEKISFQPKPAQDSCGMCDCSKKWKVTKSYLQNVVNNPDHYIQNPARLDWDWMMGNCS